MPSRSTTGRMTRIVPWSASTRHETVDRRDASIPAEPGRRKRIDYEYERNGTANLFMMFAPLEGQREVKVTGRRAGVDYAQMLKEVSTCTSGATARSCSCRTTSAPPSPPRPIKLFRPRRPVASSSIRLALHAQPWLNMAESELSVMSRQCLSRRIPDKEILKKEIAA